mmetsp:Transcript_58790/g.102881  ORF Transcript_58790/g.102881 Transcript_58790/m.102881 type:complete len:264 (+) Transcript_58790:57-848(+)
MKDTLRNPFFKSSVPKYIPRERHFWEMRGHSHVAQWHSPWSLWRMCSIDWVESDRTEFIVYVTTLWIDVMLRLVVKITFSNDKVCLQIKPLTDTCLRTIVLVQDDVITIGTACISIFRAVLELWPLTHRCSPRIHGRVSNVIEPVTDMPSIPMARKHKATFRVHVSPFFWNDKMMVVRCGVGFSSSRSTHLCIQDELMRSCTISTAVTRIPVTQRIIPVTPSFSFIVLRIRLASFLQCEPFQKFLISYVLIQNICILGKRYAR